MREVEQFEYDPKLARAVGRYLGDRIDFATRVILPPYELWDFITPEAEKEIRKGTGQPAEASQLLYYFCLAHRKMDPGFFPPQDLCMLLANLANTSGGWRPSQVTIEDIRLLPAAILLAGRDWKICLPPSSEAYRERLNSLLKPDLLSEKPESPDRATVYLGGDPRQMEMAEEARKSHPAYYLTNWDFLGVKGNEYYRRYWLENAGISGVLQIPRPGRQGISIYPAIIKSGGESASIRMAQIRELKVGDGTLDQAFAVSLLTDNPDGINSVDVKKPDIEANPACNLTPAFWITGAAGTDKAQMIRLGECAQIIRCQVTRTKYQDTYQEEFGAQPNGYFIAREAGMSALEPQCGFLLDEAGEQVSLEFKRKDNQYKYLLKANDIMFSFRGTSASLGKVGFVDHEPEIPSVTGTAFYIIRPLGTVHPLWLYWQLQTGELREEILSRSSGTSMLNISVEDTRNLPIRRPEPAELEEIIETYMRITTQMRALSKASKIISAEVKTLKKIRAEMHQM